MRKLLVFAIMLLTLPLVFAGYCENQEGDAFCGPSDTACMYSVEEADSDGDGWTDSCDAFAQDASEWFDMDADGVGHNEDCNDFDASIGACKSTDNETVSDNATTVLQTLNDGQGKVFCETDWECDEWSACTDGMQTRTCIKTNDCWENHTRPVETQLCFTEETDASPGLSEQDVVQPQDTESDPQPEDEPREPMGLTGNVVAGGGSGNWALSLILMAIIIGSVFLIKKYVL